MKFCIKRFVIICVLVISQLGILAAQNDSIEKAFVIRADGLLKYASDRIESAECIDEFTSPTVVLETLKKDVSELIVAELENSEISFKNEPNSIEKSKIKISILLTNNILKNNQFNPSVLPAALTFRMLLSNIISCTSNASDVINYVTVYVTLSGEVCAYEIFSEN